MTSDLYIMTSDLYIMTSDLYIMTSDWLRQSEVYRHYRPVNGGSFAANVTMTGES